MGLPLSRLATQGLRPVRVYTPKNGRRPVVVDEWHTIARRRDLAELLREILYGGVRVKVPKYRIEKVWCWTVREFVRLRDFRYSELLAEARRFVETYGHIEPLPPASSRTDVLELDLDVVKAFEKYLRERRTELNTWEHSTRVRSMKVKLEECAAVEAKRLALLGVCAICGGELPCKPCDLPAVGLDGRGGLVSL